MANQSPLIHHPSRRALRLLALALVLGLFWFTGMVQAQEPLTAEVNRTSATTDDTIQLTVVVSGANAGPPVLPALDGFQLVGTSSATQISVVNGVMTTQATYHYTLRPLQTGELVIGSVTAIIDQQTYATDPITVQVTAGSGANQSTNPSDAQPAPDELAGRVFFVEAEIDNPTPIVGQQIIYTFRFYQGDAVLSQPVYDAPEFAGFWSQETVQQEPYTLQAGGRAYRVTALQTVLFPTAAGAYTIEPATLLLPGTLFQSDVTLVTEPITVTVQPLPEPALADFSGAVGQFDISATVDTAAVAVNEPITLRLTISGTGNMTTLPEPVWPQLEGWRAFADTIQTNSELQDGRFGGSRTYERILIPSRAGDFTLPPISYTYFNPETAAYETVSTEPIALTVTPGASPSGAEGSAANGAEGSATSGAEGSAGEPVERLATDIRHIKPPPSALSQKTAPFTDSPLYWALWLVPLLALAADVLWQRRQALYAANPELVRRSQAQKRARQLLAQARQKQTDPYEAMNRVLTGYLSDKLDQPVAGLTRAALADLLRQRGLADPLIERVDDALALSEMGRYSPVARNGDQARELLQAAERLVMDLEQGL